MIEDIQKYDANHFLLGHESICDLDEMDVFWRELTSCNRAVTSTSLDIAITNFEKEHERTPNENEMFFYKHLLMINVYSYSIRRKFKPTLTALMLRGLRF